MRVHRWVVALAVFVLAPSPGGPLGPSVTTASVPGVEALILADFDGEPAACFPSRWKSRADTRTAARVYQVVRENGGQYLHAVAQADSVQIGLPVAFRLREYPLLAWRWRVAELPDGADEREAATNDSAAGVYVVFKGSLGGLLPRAIKYVWSTREPPGTTIPSPRYPNVRIVVLETGPSERGTWKTETVNVAEDYRRLFQSEPPEPEAIALLTDADDTNSRAIADYDDFRALAATCPEAVASEMARQAR
ncbi:MAG: DUF3047 domain-containing protein [Deltaproteobacteria bacterium]|nr:DUF3047 domain-containing protein [Deltaproteobacteria bacterium]